eukprot:TRINITY_DN17678_c0_g1_i1.p1 TRINITY_DN17678_c0_g1~~TRINITY_DN17678_c0_g1_i1.p1  ORF type:complete len:231 (-),score=46.22 TRINITY_DN17678_c0_g1_i1:17-709(-)
MEGNRGELDFITPFPAYVHTEEYSATYVENRMGSSSGNVEYGSGGGQYSEYDSSIGASNFVEPPLLEELGINPGHIRRKTMAVLNIFSKLPADIAGDRDLAGPFLFCLMMGGLLLLSGKVHFGYIYGMAVSGCLVIYILLNLISETGLDMYITASVLGYCLLPLVILSGLAIFLTINSSIGWILSVAFILWCTYSATSMFVTILNLSEQRFLIGYPIALVYSSFALMAIF